MNVQDATIQILKDAGKPLHAKEIAEQIRKAGLWSSDGKMPEATVSARLYSDIKKHGNQSTFVKVAPQTFFLRDTQLVAVCDVVRIKMAVQAKRWKGNIHSPTVQQVRGSLGAHEQGLIITTSDFSTGAIKEANQPDKTPVGLMNGEQLVILLMEYNIGVRRMSHDLFELEELPIEKGGI